LLWLGSWGNLGKKRFAEKEDRRNRAGGVHEIGTRTTKKLEKMSGEGNKENEGGSKGNGQGKNNEEKRKGDTEAQTSDLDPGEENQAPEGQELSWRKQMRQTLPVNKGEGPEKKTLNEPASKAPFSQRRFCRGKRVALKS